MFDFNFLPDEGGWLDQDPQVVEDWRVIRSIDAKHQSDEIDKNK